MLKPTIALAAALTQFSIAALAQKTRPAELVLTSRNELEQAPLPHGMELKNGPLAEAYGSIMATLRRPAGAAFARGCEAQEQALLSIPSTYSLSGALDLLTTVYTTHNWSVRDGGIDLLPKGRIPEVLNTPIEVFAWNTNYPSGDTVRKLISLANLESKFAELGIAREFSGAGLHAAPCVFCAGRDWKVEKVTLLTALNRIAASYGNVRWIYDETDCGSKVALVWAED